MSGIEEGGEVLAVLGDVVALDVGFDDAVDRLSEVVGGGLADGLPSGFGGVEDLEFPACGGRGRLRS